MPVFNKFARKYESRPSKPHRQLIKESPTTTSLKESNNERRNEKMQQDDIDKEVEVMKKDNDVIREMSNDHIIKKKLSNLIEKLPKEDRLRSLLEEDREEVNKNSTRSTLHTNQE